MKEGLVRLTDEKDILYDSNDDFNYPHGEECKL